MLIQLSNRDFFSKNKPVKITNINKVTNIDSLECRAILHAVGSETDTIEISVSKAWVEIGSAMDRVLGNKELKFIPLINIKETRNSETITNEYGLFGYLGRGFDILTYILRNDRKHLTLVENSLNFYLDSLNTDVDRLLFVDIDQLPEEAGLLKADWKTKK